MLPGKDKLTPFKNGCLGPTKVFNGYVNPFICSSSSFGCDTLPNVKTVASAGDT